MPGRQRRVAGSLGRAQRHRPGVILVTDSSLYQDWRECNDRAVQGHSPPAQRQASKLAKFGQAPYRLGARHVGAVRSSPMKGIVIAAVIIGIAVVLLVLNARWPADAEDERETRDRSARWFLGGGGPGGI